VKDYSAAQLMPSLAAQQQDFIRRSLLNAIACKRCSETADKLIAFTDIAILLLASHEEIMQRAPPGDRSATFATDQIVHGTLSNRRVMPSGLSKYSHSCRSCSVPSSSDDMVASWPRRSFAIAHHPTASNRSLLFRVPVPYSRRFSPCIWHAMSRSREFCPT